MISFNEAKAKILERASRLAPQDILLDDALGCVLAEDIISPIDLPPFDNSAMDGYAINSSEFEVRSSKFEVSQIIKAGDNPKPLEEGTCAKIMTGAAMPEGADTVVPVEDVTVSPSTVVFNEPFKKGQHVRYKGEDIKNGEFVIKKGAVITSRVIPLLAAMGLEKISVIAKPKTTVFTTGSELQKVGDQLAFGKIFDSNSHALGALLKEIGISAEINLLPDNKEEIRSAIKEALTRADILITVGGISVGDYDYVKEAFKRLEVEEIFHKVAIKPGKPLYFGISRPLPQGEREKLVFGLPGNPVSALITFDQFVKPAIYKMMGKDHRPQIKTAVAAEKLKGSKGKRDFLRGRCEENDGVFYVKSAGAQGSAMLKSLTLANCTIIIPEDKEIIKREETAQIELFFCHPEFASGGRKIP